MVRDDPGNRELLREIVEVIRDRGPITFAQFMEMALYHPQWGYYITSSHRVGKSGDFYTSTDVHPLFGGMVGELILRGMRLLPRETPFQVLELGAGKGLLCHDIMRYIEDRAPQEFLRLEYVIAERSLSMVETQETLLSAAGIPMERIRWMESFEELSGEAALTGCIISNELFDSLPVHRIIMKDGRLQEKCVDFVNGHLIERLDEPSSPLIERYLNELGIGLVEGQSAEINLNAVSLIERMGESLRRGLVLTIDYGYRAEDLYSPERFNGTLMCYHRHQAHDNPYVLIGEQDMTAHVDFSALIHYGEREELRPLQFTNQARFLLSMGILKRLEGLEAEGRSERGIYRGRLAVKQLIMPGGMGEMFKVLIQGKGLGEDAADRLGLNDS